MLSDYGESNASRKIARKYIVSLYVKPKIYHLANCFESENKTQIKFDIIIPFYSINTVLCHLVWQLKGLMRVRSYDLITKDGATAQLIQNT